LRGSAGTRGNGRLGRPGRRRGPLRQARRGNPPAWRYLDRTLPLRNEELPMNALPSAVPAVCQPGRVARRILVADDDRVTRRMLEVILGEWGYETLSAADGPAALQILQGTDAPHLAVLDWLMPGMDGLEVCRRVRAMPARQPTYLILLT